ncbi:hypothetical protein MCOR27_003371 [Pyricularia oryzae]|nr:hypothetical protein MCOR27_003371 [Pyricularia oryzae]KAI6375860.1 hypothetical protein MCOR32_005174 [Pyricularia oryzae]KAI6475285.1 hypothetical protein MCOR17_001636 [Pyricularia oryzae]KAI6486490.1 hypothetical protein MCOR18_003432 [Pyricularia oryzae]KAI6492253.1 hypothetical protein MCOR11_006731 [Pyricularia oryzae]
MLRLFLIVNGNVFISKRAAPGPRDLDAKRGQESARSPLPIDKNIDVRGVGGVRNTNLNEPAAPNPIPLLQSTTYFLHG